MIVGPRIRLRRGGPYVVVGRPRLVRLEKVERGPDANPGWRVSDTIETPRVFTLCRCGASERKPFCDAGHSASCPTEPSRRDREPLPVGWQIEGLDGPALALKPNGPIRVLGAIPIEDEDGAAYEMRDRCSLCRCGRSAAMPLCDGSHKAAGFRDG